MKNIFYLQESNQILDILSYTKEERRFDICIKYDDKIYHKITRQIINRGSKEKCFLFDDDEVCYKLSGCFPTSIRYNSTSEIVITYQVDYYESNVYPEIISRIRDLRIDSILKYTY